jgi:hypothetical protein
MERFLVRKATGQDDPSRHDTRPPKKRRRKEGEWLPVTNEGLHGAVRYCFRHRHRDMVHPDHGPIELWNTSQVTSMKCAFERIRLTNVCLSKWDTSNVKSFENTFRNSDFAGSVDGWDVSRAETMEGMFESAAMFDGDLSAWHAPRCVNFARTFKGARSLTTTLPRLDMRSARTTKEMFSHADSLTNPEIQGWHMGKVEDASSMFANALRFCCDLSGWRLTVCRHTAHMFAHASMFESRLDDWTMQNVCDMRCMFLGARNFQSNLESWNLRNVVRLTDCFLHADRLQCFVGGWSLPKLAREAVIHGGARFGPMLQLVDDGRGRVRFLYRDVQAHLAHCLMCDRRGWKGVRKWFWTRTVWRYWVRVTEERTQMPHSLLPANGTVLTVGGRWLPAGERRAEEERAFASECPVLVHDDDEEDDKAPESAQRPAPSVGSVDASLDVPSVSVVKLGRGGRRLALAHGARKDTLRSALFVCTVRANEECARMVSTESSAVHFTVSRERADVVRTVVRRV